MLTGTPTQLALTLLPQVVPNPPVQFNRENSAEQTNRQIKVWQDWIAAHKDELSKLQPTGQGVDFSAKARKNGKPRKKP